MLKERDLCKQTKNPQQEKLAEDCQCGKGDSNSHAQL